MTVCVCVHTCVDERVSERESFYDCIEGLSTRVGQHIAW